MSIALIDTPEGQALLHEYQNWLKATASGDFHLQGQHDQSSHGNGSAAAELSPEAEWTQQYEAGEMSREDYDAGLKEIAEDNELRALEERHGYAEMPPQLGGILWSFEGQSQEITEAASDVIDGYPHEDDPAYRAYSTTSREQAETILTTLETASTDTKTYSGHHRSAEDVQAQIEAGEVSFPLVATSNDRRLADVYAQSHGQAQDVVYEFPAGSQGAWYRHNEYILTGTYKITGHTETAPGKTTIQLQQTERTTVPPEFRRETDTPLRADASFEALSNECHSPKDGRFCGEPDHGHEGPTFYHGSGRESGRAQTGIPSWDNRFFVTHDPNIAELYGKNVREIRFAPDTKVLTAGTPEFIKFRKQADKKLKGQGGLLHQSNEITLLAEKAGYHVVDFRRDFIGAVVLDESKILSGGRSTNDEQPGFSNQQRKAELAARLTDFVNPCQHAPYPEGRTCDHGTAKGAGTAPKKQRSKKVKVEPAGVARYKDDPEAVFALIPADKYEGQEYLEALATPPEQVKPSSQGEDILLKQVRTAQGFDTLPQVVDQASFDAIPGVPFYRGLGGPKDSAFTEAYRSGEHYAGMGIYGNGDYFTDSGKVAKEYSFGYPRPGVVQAKLRPGARTIEFEDIADMHDAVRERVVHPLRDGPAASDALTKADRRYRDIGVYAASLGYDAMIVESPARVYGQQYYVIFNRGAIVVSEEDLK